MDVPDLAQTLVVAGLLAGVGTAVDALLLRRHIEWLDTAATRWWVFLDDLSIARLPRQAVEQFLLLEGWIASDLRLWLSWIPILLGRVARLVPGTRKARLDRGSDPELDRDQTGRSGSGWAKRTLTVGLMAGVFIYLPILAAQTLFVASSEVEVSMPRGPGVLYVNIGFGIVEIDTCERGIKVRNTYAEPAIGSVEPESADDTLSAASTQGLIIAPMFSWGGPSCNLDSKAGSSATPTGDLTKNRIEFGNANISSAETKSQGENDSGTVMVPVIFVSFLLCVATFGVTSVILRTAVQYNHLFLVLFIVLDMIACLVLFELAVYMLDIMINKEFIPSEFQGTANAFFLELFVNGFPAPYTYFVVPAIFLSVVYVPTLIYLAIMVVLIVFLIAFRSIPMYILEKGTEASGKTFFSHIGLSLGFAVTLVEIVREVSGW